MAFSPNSQLCGERLVLLRLRGEVCLTFSLDLHSTIIIFHFE